MRNPWKREEQPSVLDPLIEDIIMELKGLDGSTDDYRNSVESLRILLETKASTTQRRARIDPNTIATVAGSLVGIAMILAYEVRGNVIASKAMGQIPKPRS